MQVGVDEFLHFAAGRAYAAGVFVLVARAEDVLRQCQCQRQGAIARVPGKQLSVAHPACLEGTDDLPLDILMSDYILEHLSLSFWGYGLCGFSPI